MCACLLLDPVQLYIEMSDVFGLALYRESRKIIFMEEKTAYFHISCVTPAAPSGRVAVPHIAAAVVGPVAPEVDAVAGARDFVAAVVVDVVSSVTESTLNEIRNQAVTVKM